MKPRIGGHDHHHHKKIWGERRGVELKPPQPNMSWSHPTHPRSPPWKPQTGCCLLCQGCPTLENCCRCSPVKHCQARTAPRPLAAASHHWTTPNYWHLFLNATVLHLQCWYPSVHCLCCNYHCHHHPDHAKGAKVSCSPFPKIMYWDLGWTSRSSLKTSTPNQSSSAHPNLSPPPSWRGKGSFHLHGYNGQWWVEPDSLGK